MSIVQLHDLSQIKSFIETSDYQAASYLYKLPQQYQEIDSLINTSIQQPGVLAYLDDNQDIKALLLAFAYDDNKFKVIGPFIAHDYTLSDDMFAQLFNQLAAQQPHHATFNFSFENRVQQYKSLMKRIQASYNFTDYYLETHNAIDTDTPHHNIIPYQKGFYRDFSKLHHSTFRHNALSADDMIEQLDDNHHLFLFVSEGLLKGYLYLEISTKQPIAEIKYFSSHVDYRLKGIAFELLAYALNYAFNHSDIRKVHFKIRHKNNKLIERFNDLGFQINYEYIKYKYELRYITSSN